MESKDKSKDDSWSKAINTAVNIVVMTALVSTVFGIFATFGALFVLKIF